MGIFNKSIPKYTGTIYNDIVVEPTVEETPAFVDDVYDPLFNRAVRRRLMSTYGNPIGATLGGYYELMNSALMGNKNQGGTMLPGIGIISSFGRSMDKTGDLILGSLTEGVKGITGQGIESPLYNIFTEDEDYSGQHILAAATNSMAKLADAPEVTEADFGGVWTLPALGIDLATDPSILGGNLSKIANGTGAVADAGKILTEYDDIMTRVAIDATAPGLRPLGRKFSNKIQNYISNLRSEQDHEDAIMYIMQELDKAVFDFENSTIDESEFYKRLDDIRKKLKLAKDTADSDPTLKSLRDIKETVDVATNPTSPPVSDLKRIEDILTNAVASSKRIISGKETAKGLNSLDDRAIAIGEVIDILDKNIPVSELDTPHYKRFKEDPESVIKSLGFDDTFVVEAKPDFGRALNEDAKKYIESMRDESELDNIFVASLPKGIIADTSINTRRDFINLFKRNDLTPEQIEDVENVLTVMLNISEDAQDTFRVSQSVAKLGLKEQARVYDYIQGSLERILKKQIQLGLADPNNISASTIEEAIGELFNTLWYPKHTGVYDVDLFNVLKHYSGNKEYFIKILEDQLSKSIYTKRPYVKVDWSKVPQITPEGTIQNLFKTPKDYANSIYADVKNILKNIKGENITEESVKKVLDTTELLGVNLRELAENVSKDEYLGKIPNYRRNMPKLNKRNYLKDEPALETSDAILEYLDTVIKLSKESALKETPVKVPLKVRNAIHSKYLKENLPESIVSRLEDLQSKSLKYNELLDTIKKEGLAYEKYVGSKIGGRVASDDILKYKTYERKGGNLKAYVDKEATRKFGRTDQDSSIGYSNAINRILKRVNTSDPLSIFRIMHTRFKTSSGYKSLADLGFEVTNVPKSVKDKVYNKRFKDLTTNVKINGKEYSLIDVLLGNAVKKYNSLIESNKSISYDMLDEPLKFSDLISKKTYETYFKNILDNTGYGTISTQFNSLNLKLGDFHINVDDYPGLIAKYSDLLPKSELEKVLKKNGLSNLKFNFTDSFSKTFSTTAMFNNYVKSSPNLDTQYLNRLHVKDDSLDFTSIKDVLSSRPEGKSLNKIISPTFSKIKKLNDFNSPIENTLPTLDDDVFTHLVANRTKIFEDADVETRVKYINNMLPDGDKITVQEYEMYLKYGDGGKRPEFRYVKHKYPKAVKLFDILSKEFRLNLKAKQDRDSVTVLESISKLLTDSDNIQVAAGKDKIKRALNLSDKLKGSVSRGNEFLADLVYASGRKIVSYNPDTDAKLITETLDSIRKNIAIANSAAGGEVVQLIDKTNPLGNRIIGYRLVGDQKLLKKLSKSRDSLRFYDVVWEPVQSLTPEELKFMETDGKVVTDFLQDVQSQASSYYAKLGLDYNDNAWFKHSMMQTPEWEKFVKENYVMDIDVKTSEDLAQMMIDLDYLGDLRGTFNTLQNTRIYEGNIERYPMFHTNLNAITKNTFTKGVFANEKFQTAVSLFENNEFKLNNYCKKVDDVKNILNSEGNMRNLTIASMQYDENGMITGFKRYDNFNDESLAKALQDENAIFLPTHIFATLDKVCKHRARMSNKAYAFINRYLIAPFKIGVLLNPGFLLGNINDAGLKQVLTMSKKYGTSVPEELANLASSVRSTIYLNNKFTDIYDKYIADLVDNYGIKVPPNEKISLQVAKSKRVRDNFIKYLNGDYTYSVSDGAPLAKVVPSLTPEEVGLSRVWIFMNAVQPTEGITKELVGDIGSLNYAKNPFDRLLYGMYHYSDDEPSTWGVFNQPLSKGVFGMSEATESLARSSAILNELKHKGIDLTEFAKALGEPDNTDFNIKMLNAINTMHNSNFDYNATSPLLETLERAVPFPTFWLKNISYWFDMFINHPQYIDTALDVNEGLWANEDVSEDKFKAEAKARGAIPTSAFYEPKSGQKLSKFFKGIYKPSPLQSMFGAFSAMNNPLESLTQRTHPLVQGAQATLGKALPFTDLTTDPENIRYRPYNMNQYQPNIDISEEEFNPLQYTAHKLNPFDRTLNTALRIPAKFKRGELQLSDFLPSVFQPDFSKK